MEIKTYLFKGLGIAAFSALIMTSCTPDTPGTGGDQAGGDDTTKVAPPKIGPTKIDNNIFSLPSPIQLSSIIQKSGVAYDQDMLNKPSNVEKYTTATSQALNLGIYGADLGYTALYDKQQQSIQYMKAAQKLSDQVGITEAFDQETIKSIERNLENRDSLLYIVSNSYRKADEFLQISDRKHIGALVVVGGWIESLYFAGKLGSANKSQEIINLIGMQKHTIETLLDKMLIQYLNEPGVEEIYNELEEIRSLFDNVVIKTTYVKPEHNKEKKTTKILNTSTVEISDATFAEIASKIELLRNKIIIK